MRSFLAEMQMYGRTKWFCCFGVLVLVVVGIRHLRGQLVSSTLLYSAKCESIGSFLSGLGSATVETWRWNDFVKISCCEEFCPVPFDWRRRNYVLPFHAGKDVVIDGIVEGRHVVLKTSGIPASSVPHPSLPDERESQNISWSRMLMDWIAANYRGHVPESFFVRLTRLSLLETERLFSLMQQDEVFYLSLFSHLGLNPDHVPELLGFCGDFFVVEYVENVLDDWFILEHAWSEMMPVVRGFDLLASSLKNVSLELCDVKMENFGWDEENQVVKILDLDNIFFTDLLEKQLEGRQCVSDLECALFDCLGKCRLDTQRCEAKVTDGNLARFCRDIFKPGFFRKGLFSPVPLERKPEYYAFADFCGLSPARRSDAMSGTLLDMLGSE